MQTLKGHRGKVRTLAFAPNRNHLVSTAGKGTSISLWDLDTMKRRHFSRHGTTPTRVTFSPTGERVATSDELSLTFVWTTHSDTRVGTRRIAGRSATWLDEHSLVVVLYDELLFHQAEMDGIVRPAETIPDGDFLVNHHLVSTTDGKTLAMTALDLRSRKFAVSFFRLDQGLGFGPALPLDAPPHAVCFSPDNSILAVATTRSIRRFDTATGTPLDPLRGHDRMVTGLAFLPDGRLLSCSKDGSVRTREMPGGRCIDVHEWGLGPLTALAVARDGMRAAVGSERGEIFIWDLD